MKTILRYVFILFTLFPVFACAENMGSVCLGPFLSKVAFKDSTRPYLTIGPYGPFRFQQAGAAANHYPFLTQKFDLDKAHRIKVYFDGKVVTSWKLNFDKIGSNRVCIWRGTGAWRMDPINNNTCECPPG